MMKTMSFLQRLKFQRIFYSFHRFRIYSLTKLKQVFLSYRGSVPVKLELETPDGVASMGLNDNFLINPSPQMAAKVNEVLNTNAVSFHVDQKH